MVRTEYIDDDLTAMVRDARVPDRDVSDGDLARLRAEFVRAAATPKSGWRSRRSRHWVLAGLGGITALGAAATMITAVVLAPAAIAPQAGGLEAASVSTQPLTVSLAMARAAENISDPRDLLVSPDQLLSIEVTSTQLLGWNTAPERVQPDPSQPGQSQPNPVATAAPTPIVFDGAVQLTEARTLYVPADRSGNWVWMWEPTTVGETYGTRTAEQIIEESKFPLSNEARVLTFPAGMVPAPDIPKPGRVSNGPLPLDADAPNYDEMPRDPQALLDWYREQGGVSDDAEGNAWLVRSLVDDSLTANLAPADLRAARLRAFALIEGLEVSESEKNTATLRYRDASNAETILVTVDLEHGYVLSVSESYDRESNTVPDSIPDLLIDVRMNVIDEVPTIR